MAVFRYTLGVMDFNDGPIIDVEVIAEKEYEKPVQGKPKKVKSSDRSAQVNFYAKLYYLCKRFGFGSFLLFLFGGLAFSILFSQTTGNSIFLGFMIAFWSCTGLAFLFWLLGFLFRYLANKNMARDPNYHGEQL